MDGISGSVPWSRGTGEGIGLSGHKNEFKSGVRIGNWVEEQFGVEAAANGDRMKEFTKRQEIEQIAAATSKFEKNQRVEPNLGVPGAVLFSHGKTMSEPFGASMTALHFKNPSQRAYGAESNDRVHKSFFYGSKHIDAYVPKVEPNARVSLTEAKQAEGAAQKAPAVPTDPGMYQTTSLLGYAR